MAKFFVGQRVRLVSAVNASNIGAEGVISAIGRWSYGDVLPDGVMIGFRDVCDCLVDFDRCVIYGEGIRDSGPASTSCLEPITPEGAAPSEFSFSELMDDLMAKMDGV